MMVKTGYKDRRSLLAVQQPITACGSLSGSSKEAAIIADMKDKVDFTYHWLQEGWLHAKFLRVSDGKDAEVGHAKKSALIVQSFSDGEPLEDLDVLCPKQLTSDFGKEGVYGWHFGDTTGTGS